MTLVMAMIMVVAMMTVMMMVMVMMRVMMGGTAAPRVPPSLLLLRFLRVFSLSSFALCGPISSLPLLRQVSGKQRGCCNPFEPPYEAENRLAEVLLAGHKP